MRAALYRLLPFLVLLFAATACGSDSTGDPPSSAADAAANGSAAAAGGSAPATGAPATPASAASPSVPPPPPRNELTGKWIASQFDFDITQSGDSFTGKLCGDRNECMSITGGRIAGGRVTAELAGRDNDKKTVGTLDLAPSPDGNRLIGKLIDAERKARCEANPSPNCSYDMLMSFTRQDPSECDLLSSNSGGPGIPASAAPADAQVSGKWRAEQVAIGVVVLSLAQNGPNVTGTSCDAGGNNCFDLYGGRATGGKFVGCYAYRERNQRETIVFELALSADSQKLDGRLISTEGGGSIPVTFAKQ